MSSTFMLNDEDDMIPALVPIKKKQVEKVEDKSPVDQGPNAQDALGRLLDSSSKPVAPQGKDVSKATNIIEEKRKEADPEKIKNLQKNFKANISAAQKRDNEKEENLRSKENQKSKFMIHEMLNRLSVKNLTEELYPVSNQTIDKSINEIENQIYDIKSEIKIKEDKLAGNESNKEANKEVEKLKRSVNHCETIKELYYEKINSRNKISNLESEMIELKKENKSLRLKITKGIETIENYKKNLPSDEEKELKEKLLVCSKDLERQREMRQKLEKNIENIIMNFKRLYDQADTARLIITKKLQQIQERERGLEKNKVQKVEEEHEEFQNPFKRQPTMNDFTEEKKNYFKKQNDIMDQSTYRKNFEIEKRMNQSRNRPREEERNSSGRITMEEQIKKMRSNQAALNKLY